MSRETACTDAEPRRKASFRMLSVRIEPELLNELHGKAARMKMNVSDLVRSYVLTGLFLHDVDAFLRSRAEEDLAQRGDRTTHPRTGKENETEDNDSLRLKELLSAARSNCAVGGGRSGQAKRTAKTLKVRIDTALLDAIRRRMHATTSDLSTYVRWCIQSGLYLEDLDRFVRSKSGEDETVK